MDEANNVIDLDKSSDKHNSCSDRLQNILGDNEYKKLKLKSEGIFFDNHYEIDDEFLPANDFPQSNNAPTKTESKKENLIVIDEDLGVCLPPPDTANNFVIHPNNNFDYTIQGQKEAIKVQKPRTIDLKKVSS